MTHGPTGRIRSRVRARRYRLTVHALDEMAEEEISPREVVEGLLSGRVVRIQRDALERRVYTMEGHSLGGRRIRAVCRFDDVSGRVIVITVYEAGGE